MTKEEIVDGNRLIAEFMGKKLQKGNFWSKMLGYADEFIIINGEPKWSLSDIPYNSSYDWLMPVVEKIEKLGISTNIHYFAGIKKHSYGMTTITYDSICSEYDLTNYSDSKIEAIYNSVIKFIKWYNKATTKK